YTVNGFSVVGNSFENASVGSSGTTNYNVFCYSTVGNTIGPNNCHSASLGQYDNYYSATGQANFIRSNQPHTIPSATTAVYNFNYGINQSTTLTSNCALSIFNDGGTADLGYGKLIGQQNSTGGYNLTSSGVSFYGPIKTINPAPSSYTTLD